MEKVLADEIIATDILERLTRTLGLGIALASRDGAVLWANDRMHAEFPGVFTPDSEMRAALGRVTAADVLGAQAVEESVGEIGGRVLRGGSLRRSIVHDDARVYRYFSIPVARSSEHAGAELTAHCLLDVTPEKHLFDRYRSDLHQLSSMKEIISLLYESMSTPEVLNMILVSVTARQGFGFNRAFFLEASGDRLRGRLGIGPASVDEAHRIWSRLSESNSSLRETLHGVSSSGEPADAQTHALALHMDLPLTSGSNGEHGAGIVASCREGRPDLVTRSSTLPVEERKLFDMLGVDALAVVPLRIRERLAGVLLADNFITRRPIAAEDLALLKTFSGYAGVALERSALHDELTLNLQKLRRAHRDLQENQKRLLQAEKLSALGSLAASVSHEIRNPLVAIGGLARSVLEDEELAGDSREALEIIVSEVKRLERFLKETLDFAKPTVDMLTPVDLTQLVRDVVATFRDEISRTGVELEVEIPDEPVVVSSSPDLVHAALSNLVKNAHEAVGPGDRIRVALALVHPEGLAAENGNGDGLRVAELEVADTGPGISDEVRELIFEPFFTTKRDGTGIGLAITKQSIRNVGGNILFESRPPFNSVFKVQLPVTVRRMP